VEIKSSNDPEIKYFCVSGFVLPPLQAFRSLVACAGNGSNGSSANGPPPAWPGRVVVPEITKREGVKVYALCDTYQGTLNGEMAR